MGRVGAAALAVFVRRHADKQLEDANEIAAALEAGITGDRLDRFASLAELGGRFLDAHFAQILHRLQASFHMKRAAEMVSRHAGACGKLLERKRQGILRLHELDRPADRLRRIVRLDDRAPFGNSLKLHDEPVQLGGNGELIKIPIVVNVGVQPADALHRLEMILKRNDGAEQLNEGVPMPNRVLALDGDEHKLPIPVMLVEIVDVIARHGAQKAAVLRNDVFPVPVPEDALAG